MFVAGPHSSMILAEHGADVIKVESPAGDPNRSMYRSYAGSSRGKRCMALNMKTPEGIEIASRLISQADAIHHNFRPGVFEKFGFNEAKLAELNPELIYMESSAYGATGPESKKPGFDMMFQALCGHEFYGAGEGNDPHWYRFALVDYVAGNLGAISLLSALYKRMRTGKGARLKLCLYDAGIYALSEIYRQADGSFAGLRQLNADKTGFHPAECLYQTKDGWIAVYAMTAAMAAKLAESLAIDSINGAAVETWGGPEQQAIAAAVKNETTDAMIKKLDAAGVWANECRNNMQEGFLLDNKMQELGLSLKSNDKHFGELYQIGRFAWYSRTPVKHEPRNAEMAGLGQHSREILAELDYSGSDIDSFYENKIVI